MGVHTMAISTESIYRPSILIPCPDRCKDFDLITSADTKKCAMWGIRYRTLDRTGYEEELFAENEIAEQRMNENNNNNDGESIPLFLNDNQIARRFQRMQNNIDPDLNIDIDEDDDENNVL